MNAAGISIVVKNTSKGTSVTIRECGAIVSRVSAGGASDGNRNSVLLAHWHQARRYYPGLKTDFHYLKRIVRERLAAVVKKCLPVSLVRRITASRA